MRLRLVTLLTAMIGVAVSPSASAEEMLIKNPVPKTKAKKMPVYKAPVYKAPQPVPETPSGFYIGGHVGGGWSRSEFSNLYGAPTAPFTDRANQVVGGVQLGYNWQYGPTVWGIQGDISFTDLHSGTLAPPIPTTTARNTTKWISTLTGRAGYAWDKTLWYAKGGAAWVRNEYALIDPTLIALPINATDKATRSGYVVGGGWEYAFAPNWSGFVEYNYIGLGTKNITLADPVNGVTTFTVAQSIQMVKVGLNLKLTTWPYPWPR